MLVRKLKVVKDAMSIRMRLKGSKEAKGVGEIRQAKCKSL